MRDSPPSGALQAEREAAPTGVEAPAPCFWRAVAALPGEMFGRDAVASPMLGQALAAIPAGGGLTIAFGALGADRHLRTAVGLDLPEGAVSLAGGGRQIDQLLAVAFPEARFEAAAAPASQPLCWSPIRPLAFDLSEGGVERKQARLCAVGGRVADADAPLIPHLAGRDLDLARALAVLQLVGPVELRLKASAWETDGRVRRGLDRLKERLAARADRMGGLDDAGKTLLEFAAALGGEARGVRLEVSAGFRSPPDQLTLDLAALALWGTRAGDEAGDGRLDLRDVWPAGWTLPALLPTARAVAALVRPAAPKADVRPEGALVIGSNRADNAVQVTAEDRARHLYVIGATGTGKSTLMLNLMAQDFAAGEGVIVVDPHGDLADDARSLVPAARRADLIFADAADPQGAYRLNILAGQGGNPALERNYVANSLIRLFTRVLYVGVPEAFGPMFEIYFRNALLLLMEADGDRANLLDFDAIFFDEVHRRLLLERCADQKVKEFWTRIADGVTYNEITLNNIAPYITCKLAQVTGNPLMRRVLCQPGQGLDLARAMNERRIVILKAPKGLLGQSDTELLAALSVMQIAQASMARAALPRERRTPVRVYIDEFQTCAGEGLSDVLAEARKFGLSLVLANQSLGQIDGFGRRPDTGAAALANAANLIAFRVGAPDAARLGPWFAPDVDWRELCRLPDFHAIARVLDHGRPVPAQLLRMAGPPA